MTGTWTARTCAQQRRGETVTGQQRWVDSARKVLKLGQCTGGLHLKFRHDLALVVRPLWAIECGGHRCERLLDLLADVAFQAPSLGVLSRDQALSGPSQILDESGVAKDQPALPGQIGEELLLRRFDHAAADHGQRFVDVENTLAAAIAQHGLNGDDIEQAVRGADFIDIRPALVEALERIGLTHDQFVSNSTVIDLMNFMDDLPTRYVTNVMRSAKHRQTQQKWEPNDFIDIVALPVAAVYCDVVITEKQWVHRMRQGKVDQQYNTVLLNDTADLVKVLVNASVA